MHIEDSTRVTRLVLSQILGVAEKTVTRLYQQGVLPQSVKGKYDLAKSVQAFIAYRSHGAVHEELRDGRKRWEDAKARREELLLRKLANELLPAEEAQVVVNEAMQIIASRMDGLPGRLASQLAGMSDPALIRKLLLDELRQIRATAADRLAVLGAVEVGGADPEAPAPKKSRSVGKRKPRAAPRKRRARAVEK